MSGTVRAGLLFGLAALVAFVAALFLPIPCVNFILSLGSVIALGWGAGYSAAKWTNATSDQRLGRGLTAGAIGGVVLLLGSTVAFLLLSSVLTRIPSFNQALSDALSQNPDAASQLNPDDIGAFLGVGFGIFGFCLGLVNFLLMLLGSLIGGLMWKGAPAAAYVPAGGSYGAPPNGSYIPSQSSGPSYTPPADTGGARIYDPNDPNRPQ